MDKIPLCISVKQNIAGDGADIDFSSFFLRGEIISERSRDGSEIRFDRYAGAGRYADIAASCLDENGFEVLPGSDFDVAADRSQGKGAAARAADFGIAADEFRIEAVCFFEIQEDITARALHGKIPDRSVFDGEITAHALEAEGVEMKRFRREISRGEVHIRIGQLCRQGKKEADAV